MNRRRYGAYCAALLALLAASGYAGAKKSEPAQTVSVPIVFEPLDEDMLAEVFVKESEDHLETERAKSLALLDEVIQATGAAQTAVQAALEHKTRIAAAMESEARLEAALDHLGIHGVKAVSTETGIAVFAPAQTAFDDKARVQIVDMAASVTGLSADSIKIIHVKNE